MLRMFQSRNRDTFRFKTAATQVQTASKEEFQSRNRDTFRFKDTFYGNHETHCQFQSRNRDTFRFK